MHPIDGDTYLVCSAEQQTDAAGAVAPLHEVLRLRRGLLCERKVAVGQRRLDELVDALLDVVLRALLVQDGRELQQHVAKACVIIMGEPQMQSIVCSSSRSVSSAGSE